MKSKDLIRRKRQLQLSDLQLLIILELAERGRLRLTDLVNATGASISGVWNSLINPALEGFFIKEVYETGPLYSLTSIGRRALGELLAPVPRVSVETPPP
jgi:hypothetical protein